MVWKSLYFGLRKRCPRCGISKIYEGWSHLIESCPNCQNPIREREPDTWFFMYISTAGITGIFILFMFLYRPASQTVGRLLIAVLAIIAIVGTVPNRKGVAIAIDWLFKQKVQ